MPNWPTLALALLLLCSPKVLLAADIFDLGDIYFETVGTRDTFEGGLVTSMLQGDRGIAE